MSSLRYNMYVGTLYVPTHHVPTGQGEKAADTSDFHVDDWYNTWSPGYFSIVQGTTNTMDVKVKRIKWKLL